MKEDVRISQRSGINVDVAVGWSHHAENGNIDKTSEIFIKRQSLSYIASMMHESMYIKHQSNYTDRGKPSWWSQKTSPKATLSTTKPKWICLKLKSGFRGTWLANNRLNGFGDPYCLHVQQDEHYKDKSYIGNAQDEDRISKTVATHSSPAQCCNSDKVSHHTQ